MTRGSIPLLAGLVKTVMLLVGTVAVLFVAWGGWLYATQRSQIYFPTPAVEHPGAQVWWVESQGERLKVWVVARPGTRALLYFGGNADDVAGHIDAFSDAFPEHSLYFVNYRGYGGSSGRPSEPALVADALAVFDQVQSRQAEVSVMGRSLGSGVAVQLAAERPVSRLVLVTPFDSLVNVATRVFPLAAGGTSDAGSIRVGESSESGQGAGAGGDCGRGRDHSAGAFGGVGRCVCAGAG